MKLRFDLLKHLSPEDVLEEVVANTHRYSAEPVFARTGVGSLKTATAKEIAEEIERGEALKQRLEERALKSELAAQANDGSNKIEKA